MLYSSVEKNYPSRELASSDSNVKVKVGGTFEISIEQALHPGYGWILKSYDQNM
jgi:hypothetical protein